MPHLSFEYSANLEQRLSIQKLCESLSAVAVETGVFPAGGIRVRAVRCDHYVIADAHPQNSFIDLVVKIGEGRSAEVKKNAGKALFDHLKKELANELSEPHFALSMQIVEIDGDFSWKANSIHKRLAGQT